VPTCVGDGKVGLEELEPTSAPSPPVSLAPSTTSLPTNAPSLSMAPSTTSSPTITGECFGADDGGQNGILYKAVRGPFCASDCQPLQLVSLAIFSSS